MGYEGTVLQWPVRRALRSLRVFVVEPERYQPDEHGAIFDAALTALISPSNGTIDPFTRIHNLTTSERFDLITFPEAFLPSKKLVEVLKQIGKVESLGCVHVGLRPSSDLPQHLFSVSELQALVLDLKGIPHLHIEDLTCFDHWLGKQSVIKLFNVGCLFFVDADGLTRVCLHPKMVRSKFEQGRLQEDHMAEADMLSIVTLRPVDKRFKTVTLQPLLCSDALNLNTERPGARPLDAVNTNVSFLGDVVPDHVDIVSVATCTPTQVVEIPVGITHRKWHQQFRDSFVHANDDDLARHNFSVFVLANFRTVPDEKPGGLSGAYVPIAYPFGKYPGYVTKSSWGRAKNHGGDKTWSDPIIGDLEESKRLSFGYIASLNPESTEPAIPARMFGFTVDRLPRDTSQWNKLTGLVDFRLLVAFQEKSGEVVFKPEKQNA